MQINILTQQATKLNPMKPKPACHLCKKLITTETSVVNSRKRETKMTPTKIVPVTTITVITTVVKQTLTPTTTKPSVMPMRTVRRTERTKNQELSPHPVRPVAKPTTPEKNAFLEPMQLTDSLPGMENRWNTVKINKKTHKSIQLKVSRLQPKL